MQGHRLAPSASIAINGDSLATQFVGQKIRRLDFVNGGGRREIDRLADCRINVPLPSSLHSHMPFGSYIPRRAENVLQFLGDAITISNRAAFEGVVADAIDGGLVGKMATQLIHKNLIKLQERLTIEDLPDEGQRKDRLYPA